MSFDFKDFNSYKFTALNAVLLIALIIVSGTEYRLDVLMTKLQNVIMVTLSWQAFGYFWLGRNRYDEHDEKIASNPIAISIYLGSYVIALAISISSIV